MRLALTEIDQVCKSKPAKLVICKVMVKSTSQLGGYLFFSDDIDKIYIEHNQNGREVDFG